jgi:hypothetical protein
MPPIRRSRSPIRTIPAPIPTSQVRQVNVSSGPLQKGGEQIPIYALNPRAI